MTKRWLLAWLVATACMIWLVVSWMAIIMMVAEWLD